MTNLEENKKKVHVWRTGNFNIIGVSIKYLAFKLHKLVVASQSKGSGEDSGS